MSKIIVRKTNSYQGALNITAAILIANKEIIPEDIEIEEDKMTGIYNVLLNIKYVNSDGTIKTNER